MVDGSWLVLIAVEVHVELVVEGSAVTGLVGDVAAVDGVVGDLAVVVLDPLPPEIE